MENLPLIQPKMASEKLQEAKLIKEALKTDDLSLENFKKRLDALQKLGREVYKKIEKDGV